ncbi:unnamed protein product [Commensalibacter papalotli (ex Botero et al. 2024)]|uniref:Uncharacterized protein n=1 Tax=Commensalibacter papalotli (ex Botero et al. 2024) TaxID=2972766 RepID=A0ABM9HNP2_9PROT|nr:unnamed protein product [Commensalibacter papalotli (ex Botero et al. 2024)]
MIDFAEFINAQIIPSFVPVTYSTLKHEHLFLGVGATHGYSSIIQ